MPASAAQMAASLDRDTIYLGTQTLLTVEVADAESNEWPTVAPVDGLQIARSGAPGIIHTWINGTISRRYQFRFTITPARAGTFVIPSVSLGNGPDALKQGPLTLTVQEAALKFLEARVEPDEIRIGQKATVTIAYQGLRPGKSFTLPDVKGLSLRVAGPPQTQVTRQEGLPISIYRIEITATQLGTYEVKGISLDGAPADPVTLRVSSFVVAGMQLDNSSLAVGGQTLLRILIQGLPQSAKVHLVAPAGLKIEPAGQQDGPGGGTIFAYRVTATEPGAPTITTLQLADGAEMPLAKPIRFSVHQAGKGGILAGRGSARSRQTTLGEPFIVDYEVFFRGDLNAAGIDLSQAEFANKPYIKVEPVRDLSYKGWSGQPTEIGMGRDARAVVLLGSGDLNGQKQQLMRFALKITPLAVGEVDLKGVRVILKLTTRNDIRPGGGFFQGFSVETLDQVIDLPPHRVIDPPGKTQPPGYRGAVGTSFTYTTALDRITATAMAPLMLTMKITGEGVGPEFKPPPLAEIPELSRDFDVSPTTGGGEVQDNTITFTQVIRPRSEAVKELPALPLVYYNYLKKDYERVYSLPIPISVTAGSLVGAAAMQARSPHEGASQEGASPEARNPQSSAAEIVSLGANYTTLGDVAADGPLGSTGVIVVLLAGPLAILSVWAGRTWHHRRRPLAAIRRQRRQLVTALEQLDGQGGFYVTLADLVQSYLRLTFSLPPGEISAGALEEAMDRRAVDRDLRRKIEVLLTCCDTGRFAVTGADEAERARLVGQARQLFAELEKV